MVCLFKHLSQPMSESMPTFFGSQAPISVFK